MLDYCKGHRPTLIIYGNVDAIDDKVSTTTGANLSLLIEAMGDLQYEGEKVMTDGQEFGLLCRRRRLYVLFVDMSSGLKPSAGFLESFEPSWLGVCAHLRAWTCCPKISTGIFWPRLWLSTRQLPIRIPRRKVSPRILGSIDRHISYAEQLGVQWNGPVAQELQQNDWYETLTGREADDLVLSRVADPSCFFRNLS